MTRYSDMTPADLLNRANDSIGSADAIQSLRVAEIKLTDRANELSERLLDSNKATREVAEKQLAASEKANSLTEELLLSNEKARKQNEDNAKSMNAATQQLADSTKWLKWATIALAIFTAVQAAIALAALLKN